ncbi:short-chain dehydrogenase [Candidatus Marinamargulisbacteria bacterium SCGC AG-439-L15]|nr:short-chain dehydrogenase [Candidatus Marinamargulisbacteria bacterium SCGC AG-439-L15]
MKTVVITGANRGIGLALSKQYHQNGDHVIALCRKASDELEALGVQVIEAIDVSVLESLIPISEKLGDQKVDVLINNAGILRQESIENLSNQAFEQIQDQLIVNSMGPLKVVSCLLPHLKSGSKVALITSRMGSIEDNTSGSRYGYRMSKAALNAAGKSLAIDLAPQSISVGIIHPGYVQTEMTGGSGYITAEESATQIRERIGSLTLERSGQFFHANGELLPW